MLTEILERVGLKYEDLNSSERETLNRWSKDLQNKKLSIGNVKEYIHSMRDSVEKELTSVSHNSKHDILLKARLRNYMLLEAFLDTPKKAQEALDQAMSGLVSSIKKS